MRNFAAQFIRPLSEFREGPPAFHAVVETHGDGRRRTYGGEPHHVAQGRRVMRRHGFEALPERPRRGRRLTTHHRQVLLEPWIHALIG